MAAARLLALLKAHESTVLEEWIRKQSAALGSKLNLQELRGQSQEFLRLVIDAIESGTFRGLDAKSWSTVKTTLANISRARGHQGFSPSETAMFIFSLKKPVFNVLKANADGNTLGEDLWTVSEIFDQMGLYTTEVYQKTRDEIILRQQEEMMELSTPVVKLWEGILALPMIGTLDSSRTQVVMETLLQRIVETNSEIAIIDITGVPTVDTLVAQHLIKTVTAARLMGAECIISGIRPQIAATIVHLGVDLGNVVTKATLADAFLIALSRMGRQVMRVPSGAKGNS